MKLVRVLGESLWEGSKCTETTCNFKRLFFDDKWKNIILIYLELVLIKAALIEFFEPFRGTGTSLSLTSKVMLNLSVNSYVFIHPADRQQH